MKSGIQNKFLLVSANMVIGGTASELGGGKFANGATTAAFVMLFNEFGDHEKSNIRFKAKSGKLYSTFAESVIDNLAASIEEVKLQLSPVAVQGTLSSDLKVGAFGEKSLNSAIQVLQENGQSCDYSLNVSEETRGASLGLGLGGNAGFVSYFYTGDNHAFSSGYILGQPITASASVSIFGVLGIGLSISWTQPTPGTYLIGIGLSGGAGVGTPLQFGIGKTQTKIK